MQGPRYRRRPGHARSAGRREPDRCRGRPGARGSRPWPQAPELGALDAAAAWLRPD